MAQVTMERMKAPSPPPPPDPAVVAGAQTANNVSTAIAQSRLNNVNQITPYGSLEYNEIGTTKYRDPNTGDVYDIPKFQAVQKLKDGEREILAQERSTRQNMSGLAADQSSRLRDYLQGTVNTSTLPEGASADRFRGATEQNRARGNPLYSIAGTPIQTEIGDGGKITRSYGTDFSKDRRRVENALFSRLNPQLERDRESLRTSLINQGVREGSEAFDRAMNRADEASTDARMQAILAGGQEQSRMTGLERDRAAFENQAQGQAFTQGATQGTFANQAQQQRYQQLMGKTALANEAARDNRQTALQAEQLAGAQRTQAMQEAFALRNQPINEIGALLGSGQVTQPSFVNPQLGQIANVDRAGIEMDAYGQELDAWKTGVANKQSLFGGLLGAAGTLGGAWLGGF